MMTDMAKNVVILQVFYLSYDVASWVYSALSLYTKHICCPLNTIKINKHTCPILCINNVQRDNPRLPSRPSFGWQRLRIVTTQAIKGKATLRHKDSFPREKEVRRLPLAALQNTPLPFVPSHTSTPSSNLDRHTSTFESLKYS